MAYKHLQQLFDAHLEHYLRGLRARQPSSLYEPQAYILSLGGKRIRPLLCLAACELSGGNPAEALQCALAIEVFHNFSLIHDDILDSAPMRRSQPTVHARFGNSVAILSGDAMLVEAFGCLRDYPDQKFRELVVLLQKTATEVCEGQQLDLEFEKREMVSADDYIAMITLKTAVLLGCSLEMGSICAGGSVHVNKSLYAFGKHLGIAFQLLDDLLDCFPAQGKNFGKRTGGDIVSNKKTFLWLKARELSNQGQRAALDELGTCGDEEKKISSTLTLFSDLQVDRLCREEADRHTRLAIEHVSSIEAEPDKKEKLRQFAEDLLQRQI